MSRKVGILVTTYVAALVLNLDVTIVNVALPAIARDLDAGTRGLQWVVDGYSLAFAGAGAGGRQRLRPLRPTPGARCVGLLGFAATSVVGAWSTASRRSSPPASAWASSPH